MKCVSYNWNPDRRDIVLEVPIGSQLLLVRMSPPGHVQAVFAIDETETGTEPFPLRICTEAHSDAIEGMPGSWRHVGNWTYNSGQIAHAFQPIEPPKRRGRPPKAAKVDSEDDSGYNPDTV